MPLDPILGELHSSPGPDQATSHWVGRATFPPTGDVVDYQFNAPNDGPTETQRDLLRRIHRRYPELQPQLLSLLQQHLDAEGPDREDPPAGRPFRLVALWLPSQDHEAMEWDLTFEDSTTQEQYMVDMKGWSPVGVAPA